MALASGDEANDERALERRQVELACAGDHGAFRAIVERHHRGLFALCVRTVGDRAEAEDLVQESFARAYARLDTFDSNYRLSTWLYRVALNACRDHLKSPRRRERPSSGDIGLSSQRVDPGPGAHAQLVLVERAQRLRRALVELRPAYREIIVLKDLQEHTYKEISEMTGAPITALKIRAVRARTRLRALLEEMP